MYFRAFEEKISQMKVSIVEKNALLSQSIAHFQKVHVQSQRLQNGMQSFSLVNPSVDATNLAGSIRLQRDQIPTGMLFCLLFSSLWRYMFSIALEINVHAYQIRGREINAYQCISNGVGDQLTCLLLVNKRGSRM